MKALKLKLLSAAAIAMCFSVAPSAQATTLSSFLTFDGPQCNDSAIPELGSIPYQCGGEDKLQDDSQSKIIFGPNHPRNPDTGALLPGYYPGDIIYGQLTLSDIQSSGLPSTGVNAPTYITLLFSAEVLSANADGSFNLQATNGASAYSLTNLLDSSITGNVTSDSIGVWVSTTTASDPANNGATAMATSYTTANGWSAELVAGLVGDDDFFQFDPSGAVALEGNDRGGFTIQWSAFDVTSWAPVDVVDYQGNVHLVDFTLDQGTVNVATAEQLANGWSLRNQSTFFINPIPEPATIGLLGLGLLGMGASLRRRKA